MLDCLIHKHQALTFQFYLQSAFHGLDIHLEELCKPQTCLTAIPQREQLIKPINNAENSNQHTKQGKKEITSNFDFIGFFISNISTQKHVEQLIR